MSIDAIRTSTKAITADPVCGLEAFFVLKDASGQYSIKKADFTEDAQLELKNQFKEEINSRIADNDAIGLMKITAADSRSDVIFEYDIPDADQAIEIKLMSQLAANTDFQKFSFSNDSVDKIKAILMIVGTATKNMIIYKHVYPISLFKHTGFFSVGERIESMNKPMIRIGSGFDFFTADAIIQSIKNINLIHDITSFEARILEKTFARKLARVSTQSLILSQAIPHTAVIDFIENHPTLKTKLNCDSVNSKIILDTKISHEIFVELLRDAYLRSELTNANYHAIAKDSL